MIQHKGVKWKAGVVKGKEKHLGKKSDCILCALDEAVLKRAKIVALIQSLERRRNKLDEQLRLLRGNDL